MIGCVVLIFIGIITNAFKPNLDELPNILRSTPFHAQISQSFLRYQLRNKGMNSINDDINKDLLDNCTEYYITQDLDHYNWRLAPNGQSTYKQRYFICNEQYFKPNSTIFFYTGNESPVTLYVNNTGLMWENSESFNAMLIFAEMRYFGKSFPFEKYDILFENNDYWSYLNIDQAMADYATLIEFILTKYNSYDSKIIGFGGSLGGMICSWFRIKFPMWINGCISGSAPIMGLMDLIPSIGDGLYFADGETFDASKDGGNPTDNCKNNIHTSWDIIFNWITTPEGRTKLKDAFNLCTVPVDAKEANYTVNWILSAVCISISISYIAYIIYRENV